MSGLHFVKKDNSELSSLVEKAEVAAQEAAAGLRVNISVNDLVHAINTLEVGESVMLERSRKTVPVLKSNLRGRGLVPDVDISVFPVEDEAINEGVPDNKVVVAIKRISTTKGEMRQVTRKRKEDAASAATEAAEATEAYSAE